MTPLLLASLMLLGQGAAPGTAPAGPAPVADRPFSDVPRGHWAYDAVEELRKRGILRGYPAARPGGARTFSGPGAASRPRRDPHAPSRGDSTKGRRARR